MNERTQAQVDNLASSYGHENVHALELFAGQHSVIFIKKPDRSWALASSLREQTKTGDYDSMIDGLEALLLMQVSRGLVLGRQQPDAVAAIEAAVNWIRCNQGLPLFRGSE